tara:strand:+ start:422 stop:640 length:219 start_codon:yes stop_codon:yes gene_type:complete
MGEGGRDSSAYFYSLYITYIHLCRVKVITKALMDTAERGDQTHLPALGKNLSDNLNAQLLLVGMLFTATCKT